MSLCHRSDSFDRLNFQLAIPVFFTLCIATFINHISNIVLISTKKQMIEIYTGWIVALMTNKKAVWNWPSFKEPNCTRNWYHVLFFIGPNITIAMTTMAMPDPTSCFSNRYFAFENPILKRRNRQRPTIDGAAPRTKWIPSPITAGLSLESYSAITTIENHGDYYSTKCLM